MVESSNRHNFGVPVVKNVATSQEVGLGGGEAFHACA